MCHNISTGVYLNTVCRHLDGGKGIYLHCTVYAKKKYQILTDISSVRSADDKHALELVVMVNGPSLLKKTDTEIYGLFNEVANK